MAAGGIVCATGLPQPASGLLRAGCVACCFAGDERAVGDVSIETMADSPSMAILTAAKDSEPAGCRFLGLWPFRGQPAVVCRSKEVCGLEAGRTVP